MSTVFRCSVNRSSKTHFKFLVFISFLTACLCYHTATAFFCYLGENEMECRRFAGLQIYTWTDATLKELTNLVKEVHEDSRRKGTIFDFALIYPEAHSPGYRMRDIGSTMCGLSGPDDNKSLHSLKFQIGDFLDISITSPQNNVPIRDRIDRGPIRRDRMNQRY